MAFDRAWIVLVTALGAVAQGSADSPPQIQGPAETMVVVAEDGTPLARVGGARASRRFTPCSTFKIPHALIALEVGAVRPDDSRIAWDPERHPRRDWWPRSWARDHDLSSAIRNSVVWYFRELAGRIGPRRMAEHLERWGYGNHDTSSGGAFWLEGSLAISVDEQVAFMRRFHEGRLGTAGPHDSLVKAALLRGRSAAGRLHAKTGACPRSDGTFIGWLVGTVEKERRAYYFALNVDGRDYDDVVERRQRLARSVLSDLGIWSDGW